MEEKLIKEVKKHKILYMKGGIDYKNKKKRAEAWDAISKALDVPDSICQTRWRSLRDRFVKEYNRQYFPSGSAYEMPESQWVHYAQMQFIREQIAPRKIATNFTLHQPIDEQTCKRRKIFTNDQRPSIVNDESPNSDNTHTDNTEIPEYNFLNKFEVNVEDEAEDGEYQTLNEDEVFIRTRKNDEMFNNYEHILNDIETENKNETEHRNISVSSIISDENIMKNDPLNTNKLKHFKNKKKNHENYKNSVNSNEIFSARAVVDQNIYHREEEQLLNFFRSCIDDILMLDKRKQRLFKKRVLDIIEELQDT